VLREVEIRKKRRWVERALRIIGRDSRAAAITCQPRRCLGPAIV